MIQIIGGWRHARPDHRAGAMTMRERHGLTALTEKEKQTLRLIVRGHDAKSVAQQLDLSVHTINERLRDARRKLSVSSSREAVRMLLDAEGGAIASPPPEYMGDRRIGEAPPQPMTDESRAPVVGVGHGIRRPRIIIGATLMTLVLGLFALGGLTQMASAPPQAAPVSATAADPAVVEAARRFLQPAVSASSTPNRSGPRRRKRCGRRWAGWCRGPC